jgi:hypothetical protein
MKIMQKKPIKFLESISMPYIIFRISPGLKLKNVSAKKELVLQK